jgi:ribonuclease VapC
MSSYVLDASAVLAVLNSELGVERVVPLLAESVISAVNLAEVVGKLTDYGLSDEDVKQAIAVLGLEEVIPFDEAQALEAGAFRRTTRHLGLSLGDRACLALARSRRLPCLTAEAAWKSVKGQKVIVIR